MTDDYDGGQGWVVDLAGNVSQAGNQTISRLGPFHVAWDDPGLLEPDEIGIPTLVIPAGALATFYFVPTANWDNSVAILTLSQTGVSGGSLPIGTWRLPSGFTTFAQLAAPGGDDTGSLLNFASTVPLPAVLLEETTVYAAVYGITPPVTQGEADIYVLIATPS